MRDANISTCPICCRTWLVEMFDDCMLPSCGCFGDDVSAANPSRPCEACGISHYFEHKGERAYADAMGCDWIDNRAARQAIPPAYTEWIGHRLLDALQPQEAAWPPVCRGLPPPKTKESNE